MKSVFKIVRNNIPKHIKSKIRKYICRHNHCRKKADLVIIDSNVIESLEPYTRYHLLCKYHQSQKCQMKDCMEKARPAYDRVGMGEQETLVYFCPQHRQEWMS